MSRFTLTAAGLALALAMSAGCAGTAERKLTAAEINALLTDKTALGEHRGRATRQFFQADGTTVYLEEGGEVSHGRWRVDEVTGKYCSVWEMGGTSCYDVTNDGKRYYWSLPDNKYHSPFTVVDGKQL